MTAVTTCIRSFGNGYARSANGSPSDTLLGNSAMTFWFRLIGTPAPESVLWTMDVDGDASTRIWSETDTGLLKVRLHGSVDDEIDLDLPDDIAWHMFSTVTGAPSLFPWIDADVDGETLNTDQASAAYSWLQFMADAAGAHGMNILVCSIAIWSRTLATDEIQSIYAAGPTFDLATATGTYTGGVNGPGVWWRDAAVASHIPNAGLGAACDLILSGDAVTTSMEAAEGVETGFGSPISLSLGEAGFGSPIISEPGDTGYGSPVTFDIEPPYLAITLRAAFQGQDEYDIEGFDPAYSEDGGALVECHAAWPVKGPYKAYLRAPNGDYYPAADRACYSGIAGQGTDLYRNASGQILRFACPKVPRCTWDIVFTWEGGATVAPKAMRTVPRAVPLATNKLLTAIAVGTQLEKLTP